MTTPATTQELIADVLLTHLPNDDDAYTAADAILQDPAITVRPRRIITGEWRDVQAELDALPVGTQIRWSTGIDEHLALGIKSAIFSQPRWLTTDTAGYLTAENIARDNTPIEVLA